VRRKSKKKINKKRLVIVILIPVLVISLLVVGGILIFRDKDDNTNDNVNEVKKVDQMENYDYYLEEDVTEYYKELYNELKNVLNEEEVNMEEYAKVVAKLFVTDLFTLDNKITSSDVGGLQFVYSSFKEDFINIAKSTLYSGIQSNIYGDRNQELPIVKNVIVNNVNESTFNYNGENHGSYEVSINIEYVKDLGYPSSYTVVLINNDKYLQVVKAN